MFLSPLYITLISVVCVLIFATVVSFYLTKKKPESATLKKVSIIVRSWWMIITPMMIAICLGSPFLIILFFAVSCVGVWELIGFSKFNTLRVPIFVLVIFVTAIHYTILYFQLSQLFLLFIPFSITWIFPIVAIIYSRKHSLQDLPTLGALVLGTLLITYYLSFLPAVAHLHREIWESREQSLLAVVILALLTEANDVFQFLSGKALGKNKIVPSISPNKTEAGFIGGFILTTSLGGFVGSAALGLSLYQALILGALVSLTGMLGDLLFSAIKRHFEVKDFSDLIPGHGGLLDRLDSLILTAPVFYLMLIIFKQGVS